MFNRLKVTETRRIFTHAHARTTPQRLALECYDDLAIASRLITDGSPYRNRIFFPCLVWTLRSNYSARNVASLPMSDRIICQYVERRNLIRLNVNESWCCWTSKSSFRFETVLHCCRYFTLSLDEHKFNWNKICIFKQYFYIRKSTISTFSNVKKKKKTF